MRRISARSLSVLSLSLIGSLGVSQAQGVVYSVNTVNNVGPTLDLSPAKTYTHKLDFPGDGNSTAINGVQLSAVGAAGVDPLTGNAFSLNVPNQTPFNNGSSAALQDFLYAGGQPAGTVETLTLSGLTAGTVYDARLYYRNFGGRPNTVTVNTGGATTVLGTLNQLPAPTDENYISIKYKAESSTATFTFAQHQSNDSWHQYAVTNEVSAPNNNSFVVAGLFNTGVNNVGVAVGDNAVDSHWTFNGGNSIVATSAGGFPIGPWVGDSTVSAWTTPAANTQAGAGLFTYSTTFSTDVAGVLDLDGRLAVDDTVVGFNIDGISGTFLSNGFGSFSPFSFDGVLGAGLHTVNFVVQNGGTGPSGLRIEFTSAIFTPIPEPASLGLIALSFAGLAMRTRRQRA